MILTRLSMFRAPRMGRHMPHVPTPEQRMREYRRYAPVQFANARFHGSQSGATTPGPSNPAGCQLYERYARDACADGPPDLITHDYAALAGGF